MFAFYPTHCFSSLTLMHDVEWKLPGMGGCTIFVAPTAATLAIAHANLAKNKETELTTSASPSLYIGGIAETEGDHRRPLFSTPEGATKD